MSARSDHLSFHLSDEFVERYADQVPRFGFPMGPFERSTLGEITALTKYSRLKPDGQKETWSDICRRVIEGMFSIQRDHCASNRTPWNANKAQRSAEEAFDRMFRFKWLPPGRGLWMMGTEFVVEHGSAALQNCSFISTRTLSIRQPTLPFIRLMEQSMLGVGVGFDTEGVGKLMIYGPTDEESVPFVIPDSREGWFQSVDLLLRSYFLPNQRPVLMDYGKIRPAGAPIRGFGGTAAGPDPLRKLHVTLTRILSAHCGEWITSRMIVDIMNLIGRCVVAGNVRRSAEIALGRADDRDFLDLKNWEVNPERMGPDGWGNLSNNSVFGEIGMNYHEIADRNKVNGEPGLYWLDIARRYGRLIDPPDNRDHRVAGANPCVEQQLEDREMCTLVETFPTKCDDAADYYRTLKFAYLYGKTVTLLPTHWPDVNEVMTRNRRIGTSMSGIVQFAETHGWHALRKVCNEGYAEIQKYDRIYSEWLGIRESIKTTSVKPSGTVSLLAGVTPGVHWPVQGGTYIRRQRFRKGDPIVDRMAEAGYPVEPDVMDSEFTVVVKFPVRGPEVRSEREVSLWEKVALAALMQRHWADNMVSATFSFRESEKDEIESVLRAFEGQLKSASFLPLLEVGTAYAQMPYESIEQAEFDRRWSDLVPIDWDALYANGIEAQGERYCSNDRCEVA